MGGFSPARRWLHGAGIAAISAVIALSAAAAYGSYTGGPVAGKAITAVKMVGGGWKTADGEGILQQDWTPMLGALTDTPMTVSMKIPSGHTALFRATLSGDVYCDGAGTGEDQPCSVRVVVNGTPMEPTELGIGTQTEAATSAQFYTPKALPAGTYNVTAQWRNGGGGFFWWNANLLTVDQIQVS